MSEFQVNVVFFYFFLKPPPLKQTHNNFDRQWGGGLRSLYFNYTPEPLRASFSINYI